MLRKKLAARWRLSLLVGLLPVTPFAQSLDDISHAFDRQDWKTVLQLSTQLPSENRDSAYVLQLRAQALVNLGQNKEAIAEFDKVILLAPQSYLPYFYRGGVKYRLGDLDGALNDLTSAYARDTDESAEIRAEVLATRARIFAALKDFDRAGKDAETALAQKSSQQAGLLALRGQIKAAAGDFSSAIQWLSKAIEQDPPKSSKPEWFAQRAEYYTKLSPAQTIPAITDLQIARALGNANPQVQTGLAQLLLHNFKWREALLHFDQLVQQQPREPRLYRLRATLWIEIDEPTRAVADLEKALSLLSQGADADDTNLLLASLRIRLHQSPESDLKKLSSDPWMQALAAFLRGTLSSEKLLALADTGNANDIPALKTQALYYAGIVELANGQTERAAQLLAQIEGLKYEDCIENYLGRVQKWRLGAAADSKDFSDLVAQRDHPDLAAAQSALDAGKKQFASKDFQAALASFTTAIRTAPRFDCATLPLALRARADTLIKLGKGWEAARDLAELIVLQPDDLSSFLKLAEKSSSTYETAAIVLVTRKNDAPAWAALASLYLKNKKYQEAREAANAALNRNADLADAYHWRGLALAAEDNQVDGLKDLIRAGILSPRNPEILRDRIALHQKMDSPNMALADFNTLVSLPGEETALLYRGLYFLELKRPEDAQKDFDVYLAHFPSDDDARAIFADALCKAQEFTPARRYAEKISTNTSAVGYLQFLGIICYGEGDYVHADEWLTKAITGAQPPPYDEVILLSAINRARLKGEKKLPTPSLSGPNKELFTLLFTDSKNESIVFSKAQKSFTVNIECELYFYAATLRLLADDKAVAKIYFEKSQAAESKSAHSIYAALSGAEIKRLSAVP